MRVMPPPWPVPVADHQLGAFTCELLVLRRAAERGELGDAVVAADPGGPFDYHMRADHRAVTDFHLCTDHAVGADADVVADDGGRIDLCRGVD